METHERRLPLWVAAFAVTLALLVGLLSFSFAAEERDATGATAGTIGDPEIPVAELELLLTPLTKQRLLIEADAWQGQLQAKAEEIVRAEIAIRRQTTEIEKAQEIQEQAEEGKEKLGEVKVLMRDAKLSDDAASIEAAEEAAKEAEDMLQEIGETVEEAAEAGKKTAEVREQMSEETKAGLEETDEAAGEEVQETVATAPGSKGETVADIKESVAEAEQVTTEVKETVGETLEKAEPVVSGAEVMEGVEEAKKDEKVELLEKITGLREERTVLIDQFNAVLDALEEKTDESDSETLAKVKDYRNYIRAVSGIQVDVEDMTSAWIAIKGWVLSEEGVIRPAENVGRFLGILLVAWFLSRLLSGLTQRALRAIDNVSQLLRGFPGRCGTMGRHGRWPHHGPVGP
jgi:small conductance mechanosensitive channel